MGLTSSHKSRFCDLTLPRCGFERLGIHGDLTARIGFVSQFKTSLHPMVGHHFHNEHSHSIVYIDRDL